MVPSVPAFQAQSMMLGGPNSWSLGRNWVQFLPACLHEAQRQSPMLYTETELSFDVKIAFSDVVESSVCLPCSEDQMKELR